MANFYLTTQVDNISGSAGSDTIYGFLDKPGINDPFKSTFTSTDIVDGGAGFDTLVVDIHRENQYDPVSGTYADRFFNAGFAGNISHVEKLVLTGGSTADDPPLFPAIDVSSMIGLQQVWIEASSTFHQTDRNSYPGFTLSKVSGSKLIGIDGTYSDPAEYYGASLTVNYLASATTAHYEIADGAFAQLKLNGAGLTNLAFHSSGVGTNVATALIGHGAGLANLTALTVSADAGAHFVWLNGFVKDLAAIIAEVFGFDPDPLPDFGLPALKTVTVSGLGGALIDLTENTADLHFFGGIGNDGVLVNLANTNLADHFNGGDGHDVFGVNLSETPKSHTTLTLSAAEYALLNSVAQNFEVLGVMGDFQRQIILDAAKVTFASEIMVGQNARITNISDTQQIDFQTLGFTDALLRSDLVLRHATDTLGRVTETGTVVISGGDVLGFGGFLSKALGEEKLSGTAHLDSHSLYAKLLAIGTFDLVVDSASAWKGASNVLHGVTIDASTLDGTLMATGTGFADTLIGGAGKDVLEGGLGNDLLQGGAGLDVASYAHAVTGIVVDLHNAIQHHTGGQGTDTYSSIEGVIGGSGNDQLNGTTQDEAFYGKAGDDSLYGGLGNDLLDGGAGNDVLSGGGGLDTASYADADAAVTVDLRIVTLQATLGAGNDVLTGIDNLTGSDFNDILTGNKAANLLIGGAGDDQLYGGLGNDTLMPGTSDLGDTVDGGGGTDTVSFADATGNVDIFMSAFVSIETAVASAHDDVIYGTDSAERMYGGAGQDSLFGAGGNDTLFGGAGNDSLLGGAGNDILTGGAGADSFELFGPDLDTVTDFHHAESDLLVLQSFVYGFSTLTANQLHVGAGHAATTADQRFLFDTTDRILYYDADGSGPANSTALVLLQGVSTLHVTDFAFV